MFGSMSDAQLCAASGEGQAEAFVEVVRRYQNAVCAVTYATTQRRDLSEDLAQETFIVAWQKVAEIEQPDRLGAWLTGIARNLARRSNRRRQPEGLPAEEQLPTTDGDVEDAMIERQTRTDVQAYLDALPLPYREVMVLYYRQEQSAARVAASLGITISAVEQRLSRGRKLLRGKLERAVERELSRTQAGSAFTRRVAAAIAVAAPLPTEASPPAHGPAGAAGTLVTGAVMKKAIAALVAVLALLTVGYVARDHADAVENSPSVTGTVDLDRPVVASKQANERAQLSGQVVAADGDKIYSGGVVTIVNTAGQVAMLEAIGEPKVAATTPIDKLGRFTIEGLSPGKYTAVASAPGYLPGASDVVSVTPDVDPATVRIALSRGGHVVSGVVTDVGGGPVEGAVVRAAGTVQPATGLTDAQGRYAINVPDGGYSVRAWESDYQPQAHQLLMRGSDRTIDFQLLPASTIFGRVVERATGQVISGAVVSFKMTGHHAGGFSVEHSEREDWVTSDANGKFALRRLGAAEYQLVASADHLASIAPAEISLGIAEHVDGVVVFVDPAFNISGRIVDASAPGRDLSGLQLAAYSSRRDVHYTNANVDGTFTFPGLLNGTYMIGAGGDGVVPTFKPATTVNNADVDDVELQIERGTSVRGRVTPPGIATVRLAVRKSAGDMTGMLEAARAKAAKGSSGDDGEFTLSAVPQGEWKIIAERSDGSIGEADVVVGADGLSNVVIEMRARPALRGRIVDAGGVGVANASVELRAAGQHFGVSTTTQDDGSYTHVGLVAGPFSMRITDRTANKLVPIGADASGPAATVEVGPLGTDGFDVSVQLPTGEVAGVVRDHTGVPQPDVWVSIRNPTASRLVPDRQPVLTDVDGVFVFQGLPQDTFSVYARSEHGDATARLDDVAPGDDVDVVLERLGAITGRVRFAGKPVTQFSVETAPVSARAFVAEDGAFTLERISTGRQQLLVLATEGSAVQFVDIEPGDATTVDVELVAWASVTGRAVSAEGEPVSGLSVDISARGGERDGRTRRFSRMANTDLKTDASGRFAFDGIGVGRFSARLRARHVPVGGTHAFIDPPGGAFDLGDITVLTDAAPSKDKRGTLGLTVRERFGPPRVPDDSGSPQVDKPLPSTQLWVTRVDPDGPAQRADLTVEQRIVSVNGKTQERLGAPALAAMLSDERIEAGRTYALEVVDNEGRTKTFRLKAKPSR